MQILVATAFRASFKSSITNLVHTTLCCIIFETMNLHTFLSKIDGSYVWLHFPTSPLLQGYEPCD